MGGRAPRGRDAEARLCTWDPDRSSLRWDGTVYTDDGEPVTVFKGTDLQPTVHLNLMQECRGRLTDVLYSPVTKLLVSERAAEVILASRHKGVTVHRLNLRHRDRTLLREYFWLSVRSAASLLDRERSVFRSGTSAQVDVVRIARERRAETEAVRARTRAAA